jgi:YfiH family protein
MAVMVKSAVKSKSKISVLREESLARIPWSVHGFSTRAGGFSKIYGGGALNLGFTAQDSRAAVEHNRQAFLSAAGAKTGKLLWPIVSLKQIHSDLIRSISEIPKGLLAGDGLITRTPEILIAVQTADCIPVILVDTKQRAVGVFHAGWRGTVKRIVEKGVGEMQLRLDSRPEDLSAAIGPGIRGCCYQVGPDVRASFEAQFGYADKLFRETKDTDEIREKYPLLFLTSRAPGHGELPKKIFLDLAQANRRQLLDAGVKEQNIFDLGLCTSCRTDWFFSHRAEKGRTGRMMAVAGVRSR